MKTGKNIYDDIYNTIERERSFIINDTINSTGFLCYTYIRDSVYTKVSSILLDLKIEVNYETKLILKIFIDRL